MKKKNFSWEYIKDLDYYYAYYKNQELGYIEYWEPWNKWVWNQTEGIIMSLSCIEEVTKKLKEMGTR